MHKLTKTILTLFSLTLTTFSNAESNIVAILQREKLAPFFYEITGHNIDPSNPVYLLGTAHSLTPQDYSDEIRNKIEHTETLISEFPEFSTAQQDISFEGLKLAYNKFIEHDLCWFHGQLTVLGYSDAEIKKSIELIQYEKSKLENPDFFKTWANQLTETEKAMIQKISREGELDLFSLHPTLIGDFMDSIEIGQLEAKYTEDSYEIWLINLFRQNNKEIIFLDNMETWLWGTVQYSIIDNLGKNLNDTVSRLKQHIRNWEISDSSEKDAWSEEEYSSAFDIGNIILMEEDDRSMIARNLAWQKKVIETMKSGKSASIITGADHLKGKSGFLSLLKSEGYNIKHVYMDEETSTAINIEIETQAINQEKSESD